MHADQSDVIRDDKRAIRREVGGSGLLSEPMRFSENPSTRIQTHPTLMCVCMGVCRLPTWHIFGQCLSAFIHYRLIPTCLCQPMKSMCVYETRERGERERKKER